MNLIPHMPPAWDGWHPIVVHLPLGVLMAAPPLLLLPILFAKHARPLRAAALVALVIAAAGMYLAASSGEAAEGFVTAEGVGRHVREHEEAAEAALVAVNVFTIAYAVFTLAGWLLKKAPARAMTAVGVVLLVVYAAPMLLVVRASHLGGRLVHEFGVQARLSAATPAPGAPQAGAATHPDTHESKE